MSEKPTLDYKANHPSHEKAKCPLSCLKKNQVLIKYKRARNHVVTMLRESKLAYFQGLGTSALCSITHNWSQALDGGNEVCSIFFDLRKAFDSVPRLHLLDKLAALHLDPRIITWLHSYLMGRSQLVVVGGEQSTSLLLSPVYHRAQC